jgi:hypothetical protein
MNSRWGWGRGESPGEPMDHFIDSFTTFLANESRDAAASWLDTF